jgi:eukaryotic-like serine/threonine-protein kinase
VGMALPNITEADIGDLIPGSSDIARVGAGGQKLVYRVRLAQGVFALKLASLPDDFDPGAADADDTVLRARRETEIMKECVSPYIVKPGPVDLGTTMISGQNVLYFSEEFIDGRNLTDVLNQEGPLQVDSLIRLAQQMCVAIEELWSLGKIHRDIKPGNIMRRSGSGDFVMLDTGLAFDVAGESISAGFLVGTMAYFSPEQFDYSSRRVMDFRSDMFSLGVTLYEVATGQHPFLSATRSMAHLYTKISRFNPPAPSSINTAIPPALDRIILRMMGKSPHLRYRRMAQLHDALGSL